MLHSNDRGNKVNHATTAKAPSARASVLERNRPGGTPNLSSEVTFASGLHKPLGPGFKHSGGTMGSESIKKGGC